MKKDKREAVQFFDGLLLGAFIIGLVLVTLIIFFLFRNAQTAGETVVTKELAQFVIEEAENKSDRYTRLENQKGQPVTIAGVPYTVQTSIHDKDLELIYRSLLDVDNRVYMSLWSNNGEQLLYKANSDVLTATGSTSVDVFGILSESELLLRDNMHNQELIYNIEEGIVQPY